ncbi:MAG: 50S ribosomal protein L16 [Candidatus Lokiarchaeota archaeon]|nr:50S ribosomal protein L16 [Candidatus Lokiarchaeota archaeon]
MARRPWSCYKQIKRPAYQKKRSRSHRKEYVRGGPDSVLRMYDTGNRKKPLEEWDLSLGIKILKDVQLSHRTLEAMRTSLNRNLQKQLGRTGFLIRVRPHPWQMIRENKMMAFAGADRLQSGMRNSFGRVIGRAARVHADQTIVEVYCNFANKNIVIKSLKTAAYKIGAKNRLVVLRMKDPALETKIGLPIALEE